MKALAVSVLALSFCMPAFSQSADSSQTKTDNMKNEKSMSIVGCIDEKDGKYMVVNKEHPKGVMLMTSEDMKPHVGHMMKIDGMMHDGSMSKPSDSTKSSNMAQDGSKSDAMTQDGSKSGNMGMEMMGMKMTGMKMMSKTCDPTK
jgi:hypothetical protein